ncbi:MAG: glycosyltransferase family 39 protein [Planctomycetes bacterium]|nr:glycosyltransferase family 39 protein [Planctomycetota bacterium]
MPVTPPAPQSPDPTLAARRDTRWLLLGLLALGLALRLPLMGRSVWFDEACMSDQRLGTWAQLLATLYVDIHPPLYVTFMHGWNALFGDSEWSMRTPPLLCGLASIPALFWTGRRLVGRRAALWAATLLTLSPAHVWYSAEARLYAPMLLSTLLAVGAVDRLGDPMHARRAWLWWLHAANLAAMLALHYYLAVHVVLLAVLPPLWRGFSADTRRLLVWHGVGVLLLGAFVLAKRALGEFETAQDYLRAMTGRELYVLLVDWCWTGNTLPAAGTMLDDVAQETSELLGLLLMAAGAVGIWRGRRHRPNGFLVPIAMLAIPLFLLATAAAGLGRTYTERSTLPTLPFVLLLAGKGLTAMPLVAGRWLGLAALGFATASLVALFRYHEERWTVYKPNPDWRAAAAYLGAEVDGGAAGRPVFTPTPNPRPLSYYDRRIQDEKNLTPPATPAQIGDRVRRRLGDWLGDQAERVFRDFADGNAALLRAAALRVYRTAADPAALRLDERMRDDVCYLVRDHWHPHPAIDGSLEALVQHPRVEVIERRAFPGITVHKVRIRP